MTEELKDILRANMHVLEDSFQELDESFKVMLSAMDNEKGDTLSGIWAMIKSGFYDIFDKARGI